MADFDYGGLLDEEEGRLQDDSRSASYADVIDAEDTAQRSNLLQATQGTPDGYAEAMRLGSVTGIPAPVVERNPQDVVRRAQLAQADEVLQRSPILAAQVADNSDFARLAIDDLDNASSIERTLKALGASASQAVLGLSESILRTPDALERGAEWMRKGHDKPLRDSTPMDLVSEFGWRGVRDFIHLFSRAELPGNRKISIPGLGPQAGFTDAADAVAAANTQLSTDTATFGETFARLSQKGQAADQAFSAALNGQFAPLASTITDPEAWAGFLGQAAPSLYTAYKSGGSVPFLAWMEGMETASDAVDFERRTGQHIDEGDFLQAVAQTATVNALLEKVGLDKILQTNGKLSSILTAALTEGGTEALQQFNLNASQLAYDQDQSLTQGVLGSFMGGAGTGSAARVPVVVAERIQERRAEADKAMRDADALANLSEQAAGSKLRARDPATFEAFVERAVTESGAAPTDLFISAETLSAALEQAKIDPAQLAQLSPALAAQLAEATVAGGDVTIRTSEFAAKIAGTDVGNALLPHLRTAPEGLTAAEAEQFYHNEAAQFAQEAQAAASEERTDAPLFDGPEAAQLTPEQWAEYTGGDATQAAVDQLDKRTLRDMRWMSNAKAAQLAELKADAAEKRKAVRGEVAAEVAREPVYTALQFFKRGTLPDGQELGDITGTKLSIPALKEMYGDGPAAPWRYLSTGKFGVVAAEDGIDPNVAAPMFGYQSGDALVRAMLEAAPINDRIEAATDVRMLERYGDLSDPKVLERAAEAAIASEARVRTISREVAALAKSMGAWPALAKAAREFAELSVAQKKIRDVRPAQHAMAEARAARAATTAWKTGDTATAAKYKREQLVQNRMNRAAVDAQDGVDSGLTYLRKFNNETTRKAVGPDYMEQIDSLLERFDLRKSVSDKQIDKRKSLLEWVQSQQEQGLDPIIDDRLLNEARRQHYREMTVQDFRNLVDAVKNIEHLGRLKQKLLTAKDQRELALILADVETSIRGNATREIKQRIESNLPSDRTQAAARGYLASHRKLPSLVREMDGGKDGGTLWELFMRPLNAAGDFEATQREQATVKLAALFKELRKGGKLKTRVNIPAIGESLSREGRIAVALNWGNEANRQRILDGEKWSPAQAQAVLDTLTKDEWDFVQGVWDFVDSYWPQIREKELRVSGIAPEKVEAAPVHTKHGDYRGGYYPIKYDPVRSSRAEADDASEALRQTMQGLYTRASTRRGHTKARAETVNRPMRKDLGVIVEHVNQVIHDLAYHEALIDTNRVLRSAPVDEAIRDHYGAEVLRTMRKALDDIATGDVPAQSDFEKGMSYLRNGVSIAGLGWNLMTSALQPLGLTQSMVRIGPKWVGIGAAKWLGGAARMQNVVKDIYARSEFMRLRGKTMNRELNEIQNKVSDQSSARTAVNASFFYFIQKAQMIADVPTWLGAYEKALADGNDEARSVALADQAVIDSQGSGQVKDMAEIQRGSALQKLFTTFYSFFNTTYNLAAESYRRTDVRKPAEVGRMAVDFLLLFTVPAVLGSLLKSALRGDDDEEDELAGKLVREQLSYLSGLLVGVRELSSVIQGLNGYSGPAGTRAFSELSKLIVQADQGEVDEALLKSLNNTAGILFHYPAGQVQRTYEGILAVIDEDAPPQAVVFGPPK